MNRAEFLYALREKLSGLPSEEIEERLSFYAEAIDDRIEDGYPEEAATAEIGTPEEIAEQIISEIPLSRLVREKVGAKKQRRIWQTVLLAVGAVVWMPLLIAFLAVIFSLYIALWAVVISLYAVCLALAIAGVCALPGAVLLAVRGNFPAAAAFLGAGIFCAGLAILMFFLCRLVTRGVIKLTRNIIRKIKAFLLRKKENS